MILQVILVSGKDKVRLTVSGLSYLQRQTTGTRVWPEMAIN